MTDLAECYKNQDMQLRSLDIHQNNITSEGFFRLMVCLKTNNKVTDLNVSRNQVASDTKTFKFIHKFLSQNKILENLNLSFCEIKPEAGASIGRGLRGNRNLQVLNLKGNQLQKSVIEIAKAFSANTQALCIKELDLGKNMIEPEFITSDWYSMLTSEYCTLQTLSLRDNFINQTAGLTLRDALKKNKQITKFDINLNPVKESLLEEVAFYCKRNVNIDAITHKNKNIPLMKASKKKAAT